jgi:hypothetical protein
MPFDRGVRVRLLAPEATANPAETGLDVWVTVAVDVRESALHVDHVLHVGNTGPKAWAPNGLRLAMPAGAIEVDVPESMGGGSLRAARDAVELVGTFPIGETELRYRYQVPIEQSAEQSLALGLPPAASRIRVLTLDTPGRGLQVAGIGAGKPGRAPEGQRILVAEAQNEPNPHAGVRLLHLTIAGLPSPGRGRWVALGAALLILLWGTGSAWIRRRAPGPSAETLREAEVALLDEVLRLEQEHATGRLEREELRSTRQGLIDALVRLRHRLGAAENR